MCIRDRHNISGAVLAWLYQNYLNPKYDPEYNEQVNLVSTVETEAE